jgi:ATP-binding cassette subfamily B protein
VSVTRVGWRLLRADPLAYVSAWCHWVVFHAWPILPGLALKAVLDRVAGDATAASVWGALAVLAGVEVARWAIFVSAVVQWSGAFVGWQTIPRLNLLRSLVADPGPTAGRLPGSPGEAVSRFRDDTRDLAMVLDVWLDVSGSVVSVVLALGILAAIDPRVTVVVVVPVVLALAFARWLGPRLKAWRGDQREATGAVTGFLGDVFGATLAVKATGAESAVSTRFAALNAARRKAARRDQVGTALVNSLGGVTGELGVGLVLLLAAPALRDGEMSVGAVGLLASYDTGLV